MQKTCRNTFILSKAASDHADLSGSAHLIMLTLLALLFVSGGWYLYSVNQNAVQGYRLRALEKDLDNLKQKNAELRIAEADLRSLSKIEGAQSELGLEPLGQIRYLGDTYAVTKRSGPVALR